METKRIKLSELEFNNGQIDGLPVNPRQWTRTDVDRIAKSLRETPELFEARPIIAVHHNGKYVILGGNLRYEGARANKAKDVPCILVPPDMPIEKMKEIVIKDNGTFGAWDYDALANGWDDLPLVDWGVPVWNTEGGGGMDLNLSTKGKEGGEGYDEFVEKFKPKLTTDDCYTPQSIYDAVVKWVDEALGPIDKAKIVRPFFPGGDYVRYDYPEGCIVIDNPPFSIYAEIVRFYLERGIRFFLFGPHLTLKVRDADCTYVLCGQGVTYENGAVVNTSFVTNMDKVAEYRIIIPVALYRYIREAEEQNTKTADLAKYRHPMELWSLPRLAKIAKGDEDYFIRKESVQEVQNIDMLKEMGKSLYGGGFLFSEAAAREAAAREAAAREAAAREAAALYLSEREKAIVVQLSEKERK